MHVGVSDKTLVPWHLIYPVLSPHVVCIREREGEYIDEFVSLLGVYNLPASSQITDRRHFWARGSGFLFQAKFAPVCFIK